MREYCSNIQWKCWTSHSVQDVVSHTTDVYDCLQLWLLRFSFGVLFKKILNTATSTPELVSKLGRRELQKPSITNSITFTFPIILNAHPWTQLHTQRTQGLSLYNLTVKFMLSGPSLLCLTITYFWYQSCFWFSTSYLQSSIRFCPSLWISLPGF